MTMTEGKQAKKSAD